MHRVIQWHGRRKRPFLALKFTKASGEPKQLAGHKCEAFLPFLQFFSPSSLSHLSSAHSEFFSFKVLFPRPPSLLSQLFPLALHYLFTCLIKVFSYSPPLTINGKYSIFAGSRSPQLPVSRGSARFSARNLYYQH